MKPTMYFGHPVNVYDTELEERLADVIAEKFPDWNVENPNQPRHQAGYDRWKAETGKGMDYYFKVVLPGCGGGVFLPFRDGAWGAGVYGEAAFLEAQGGPIYVITAAGVIAPVADLGSVRVLTVDETRLRIRTPDGKTAPY